MIKKNNFLVVFLFLLCSCTYEEFNPDEWAVDPVLELSEHGVVFNADSNECIILVTTNYNSFSVSCEEAWCEIIPNIADSTICVHVTPNVTANQRKATIVVTVERGNKRLSKSIYVVQIGGYWDVVGQFSIYWSSDVTDSQKEVIRDMLTNMVYVNGGTFVMGCQGYNPSETNYYPYLGTGDNRHKVTMSDYYINKFEVTQKQWNTIMGSNNSTFRGERLPVENITWNEAMEFVYTLSRLTNIKISLPTEAQWEYAAIGGVYAMGYIYPGSNNKNEVLIYRGDGSLSDPAFTTYDVGMLMPNELGLYNMAGNVSEMCLDWYGDYVLSEQTDPLGPATGSYHVMRGGDITDTPELYCTVYSRFPFITTNGNYIGIRLCVNI